MRESMADLDGTKLKISRTMGEQGRREGQEGGVGPYVECDEEAMWMWTQKLGPVYSLDVSRLWGPQNGERPEQRFGALLCR